MLSVQVSQCVTSEKKKSLIKPTHAYIPVLGMETDPARITGLELHLIHLHELKQGCSCKWV